MTDFGALFIGLGIGLGLMCLGSGIENAGYAVKSAVQYVIDNWGVFEKEDETE